MADDEQQTAATRDISSGDGGKSSSGSGGRQSHPELVGTTLGNRYQLTERLGAGGFGAVYSARDERLDKLVAVKVLAPTVAETPAALTRFRQEAIAAARVGHEGIVNVTDFDEDQATGLHYIVMERIEGCDLAQLLDAEGRMPLVRALCIVSRVAQALAAAHARNIIHRDLKPANILITSVGAVSDFPKLLDFGISKMIRFEDTSHTLTGAGQVVGTPRYMAPEQGTANVPVDGRADIYALGTILYEMITGAVPFTGSTHYEVIHFKLSRDPLPPSVIFPELPETLDVDRLVLKALARDLDDRFATMADFEEAVRALLAKIDPAAEARVHPAAPPPRPSSEMAAVTPPSTSSTRALVPTPSSQIRSVVSGRTVLEQRRSRWPRRLAIVGGAAVVGVLTAVFLFGSGHRSHTSQPAAVAPATPATDDAVELRFVVVPPDARISVAGVEVTDNPLKVPRSDTEINIAVSAPGYQTQTRQLRPLASGELRFELTPVTPPDAAQPESPAADETRKHTRPHQVDKLPDSPM